MGRAEPSADGVYAWAKTLVPNSVRATAAISKQAKLKIMMTETSCSTGEEFIAVVQAEERRFDHVRARGGGGGSRRVGS